MMHLNKHDPKQGESWADSKVDKLACEQVSAMHIDLCNCEIQQVH